MDATEKSVMLVFSKWKKAREENSLNIAAARILPGGDEALPFVVVADDAFPLKRYLIKSCPIDTSH